MSKKYILNVCVKDFWCTKTILSKKYFKWFINKPPVIEHRCVKLNVYYNLTKKEIRPFLLCM